MSLFTISGMKPMRKCNTLRGNKVVKHLTHYPFGILVLIVNSVNVQEARRERMGTSFLSTFSLSMGAI